jgi:ribosomal protein S18 acetylase RimI-like enzyme
MTTVEIINLNKDHPNAKSGGLVTSASGYLHWDGNNFNPSKYATVAYENGKLVGIIKYDFRYKTFESYGTWVAPRFRKNGLAVKLWEVALERTGAKKVRVTVISDRGNTLIESLQSDFPDIKWKICQAGARKLRDLR